VDEHGLASRVWRKSSYSGADGGCVEVASRFPEFVAVRDSKDATGPRLAFSLSEWGRFTGELKSNEYELK
jgi:hypothetical protein